MALLRISSPHTHRALGTGSVMRTVVLATLPGLAVLTYFFGLGTLHNVLLASIAALGFEALVMKLRHRPVMFYLRDCSALVTGVLLGLALPPYCPWWLVVLGSGIAIILAKQLYGGMGFNPFNPAMVAYVVLLISFPLQMSQWAAPLDIGGQTPGVVVALEQIWLGQGIDGYTAATPLDTIKQNSTLLVSDAYLQDPVLSAGQFAGAGWEWVNIAFLAGGAFLLYRRIFTWHAPVAMLLSLSLMAFLFYDGGSSTSGGSIVFHLLSGGTMLGAFFIVTDPVSSAVSNKGRLIYGALIGVLIYIIRIWGNYPDAIAFAVLLMNFAAPFIDYYTLPRTYGHSKSQRATKKDDT
ncbi:electron transport complex subunit RsxD [Gilvimarinus sp. SDUM040013]|uniref:Ion-translocating oxidoreductase complex subunit D n=1 Tax=Gilvimarinus gilvus TaxID=3058038 RepID=A0ABU4S2L8_9GAMM|nr:electron transport complex subunit RsxD [Gilvimarinus sp. SDUM040013]MDO3384606.1 electron transport complex subunit RsxD [Gilvimarinus sp. SDUM040013]MDX6850058.1 electron transport complex subunit RsxD [Gilvimarinus sp. SDUM040013]